MRHLYDLGTIAGALSIGGSLLGLAGGAAAGSAEATALANRAKLEAATMRLDADSIDVQVHLDQLQLDRELRDLGVKREKTLSRIKASLAAGGGQGLSSQLARVVLGEAGGEFATAKERAVQDTAIRKEMLLVRAENLRRIADFTEETGVSAAGAVQTGTTLSTIGGAFSVGADVFELIKGS